LGFSRFFLVVYRRTRTRISGAYLTIITNRVGDIGLLVAIGAYVGGYRRSVVLTGLVLASVTKSAQVPFRAWLPAAIAAPTPVSALVHSSTLVTAGVYLIVRFGGAGNICLTVLGCLTILVGGLAATQSRDVKKLVALSTLSQLGLMMYTVGSGSLRLALYHLLNHAFFKSLLFLAVGVLIHTNFGAQERRLGRAAGVNRRSSCIGILACLRMAGLPCTAGFLSKHSIMEELGSVGGLVVCWMFGCGAVLTMLYSGKLLRVFRGSSGGPGPLNTAATRSRGETPLFVNIVCGAVVLPWLGLNQIMPSKLEPMSPLFVVLFTLCVLLGARASHHSWDISWVLFSAVGVTPAQKLRGFSVVPCGDSVLTFNLRGVFLQSRALPIFGTLSLLYLI